MPVRLLIGGSPCTHWSIARTKDRETQPFSGEGWNLFNCYLTAKLKFGPDFFLYENNQSAAEPIKQQISSSLGEPLYCLNSSLLSAQSRKRFYVHNLGDIGQPEECGLVVNDILDYFDDEKHYDLAHVSKPKNLSSSTIIRLGDIRTSGQGNRVYSHLGKSATLTANGGGTGAKTGLYMVPVKIGDVGTKSQTARVFSHKGKSCTQVAGHGGKECTGLYTVPSEDETTKPVIVYGRHGAKQTISVDNSNSKTHEIKNIHVVKDGIIETRYGTQKINLPDGSYIIRKLKPVECERLQTLPDGYTEGISNTQRYKCIGNGWTAEVIKFILSHMNVSKDEEIQVLSMFDGIGTGRYVLDQLGFTNIKYFAYEIDPYAIQIAKKNYPDIVELGDAFDVMREDWNFDEILSRYK